MERPVLLVLFAVPFALTAMACQVWPGWAAALLGYATCLFLLWCFSAGGDTP